MSIVEKAISKLRQAQPNKPAAVNRPAARAPEQTAQEPDASFGVLEGGYESTTGLLPVGEIRPTNFPPRKATLNVESLRADTLLPPLALERQLQDQYRRIKWPLLDVALARNGAPVIPAANLIMIASSVPGEGKTFSSINLALSIAQERDYAVLLVDADVARANLTQVLGLGKEPGLGAYLTDDNVTLDEVLLTTDVPGLEVLPAGRPNANAPELFGSNRMVQFLNDYTRQYPGRVVIFDSSPVLATNEAQVLSRLVGQIVMVVRAGSTPQAQVVEALNLLDRTKSVSCLLNQVEETPSAGYYGANAYYGYEREQEFEKASQ
jgi:protein-tyrosine kinase